MITISRAAYIGRFQPLHQGHYRVIQKYSSEFDDFLVVIGSSDKKKEQENPLSTQERIEIIENCFQDLEIMVKKDQPEKDQEWGQKLEKKTGADIIISQNDHVVDIVKEYTDMEPLRQEKFDPEIYSGQEVRRRIRSGEEWSYLVPKCARDKINELEDVFKKTGVQYEFTPGWKKENIKKD